MGLRRGRTVSRTKGEAARGLERKELTEIRMGHGTPK